jgi:hypothetical protein
MIGTDSKKTRWSFLIGIILIVGIFFLNDLIDKTRFRKNGKIAMAKIMEIDPAGKSGLNIKYRYVFSNKTYENSCSLAQFSKAIYELENDNRALWVLVDTTNPRNAHLLLNRHDFEKYQIAPTDSVNWIFNYTEN